MAQIRKPYVPRNINQPEIEKAFLAVYRAMGLQSLQSRKNIVETAVDLTLTEINDIVVGITNAVTITLPPAATYYSSTTKEGIEYSIANDYTNTNNITLQADGAELVGKANTLTIPPGASPNVVTNGTKWIIH
jgi:hypothetical protein